LFNAKNAGWVTVVLILLLFGGVEMGIEKLVSKEVWTVINDNYEKSSYTTAVTNLMQYANEIIREKSGLSLDNTKLMDAAFFGQNPKLIINKYQTQTEKDIQSGVGYLLKGLCLAVRNPRAHERYNDKRETADAIIMFIDYVLEFVRNSKFPGLVEDWLEFVFDEHFNNTEEYAEIVLQEIPEKKRYELLVNIFRLRERAKQYLLNNLVNKLMDNIKPEELQEFLDNLNKDLLYCSDDKNLRAFLILFPPEKWSLLIPLTKLKIENMIQKSIEQAQMFSEYLGDFDEEPNYRVNSQGTLSTWAVNFIIHFDTKENIIAMLGKKLCNEDVNVRNYVISYYKNIIFSDEATKNAWLKFGIQKSIKYFDKEIYEHFDFTCNSLGNPEIKEAFGKEIEIANNHYLQRENSEKEKSDIPF